MNLLSSSAAKSLVWYVTSEWFQKFSSAQLNNFWGIVSLLNTSVSQIIFKKLGWRPNFRMISVRFISASTSSEVIEPLKHVGLPQIQLDFLICFKKLVRDPTFRTISESYLIFYTWLSDPTSMISESFKGTTSSEVIVHSLPTSNSQQK